MRDRSLVGVSTLLLAFCACNSAAPSTPFSRATSGQTTSVARRVVPLHADRRQTWISPELNETKAPVLFVSDAGTADVYIYNLKTLKRLGTVTGFNQPQGECSDAKGNVWVADANATTIYELSHEGRLEKPLNDSQGFPVGCAWDATSGNLAVMNLFGAGYSGSAGNVLVYPKGGKTPATITNAAQYNYYFGSYDTSGNLFFDGRDANGNFMLSELSKGAKSAHTIAVSGGSIYYPGMVQWDSSKHVLIVGDQSCGNAYTSCLYTVKISGSTGTITGSIQLQNSKGAQVCDLVQGEEYNGQLAGSDFDFCGGGPSTTYLWPYPAGGAPTVSNAKTDTAPVGAAVSSAPSDASRPHHHSWMHSGTANRDLLYVADVDNEVTVYDYKSRNLEGVLTGFTQPMGECVDPSGDVYITDYAAQQIVEYAHGGSQPIKTLSDAPDSPYTCSVDPTTGNLAVANNDGTSQEGNIAIWTKGSGSPTTYTDSQLNTFVGCAYDNAGVLLVTNGYYYNRSTGFAWLPPGGKKLINVSIPGPKSGWNWDIYGIVWDGKFFVLENNDLYRISLLHGQAYYIGETQLTFAGSGRGPYQYSIYDKKPGNQGTQVIGSEYNEPYSSTVEFWQYPSGGNPIAETSHGVDRPFGLTVSLPPASR